MLKPETRDLDEWIDGFFKKIGAEQGANDPNTRQRIIMAVQEWTASRKHFSEKLRLVFWWQWLMLTPADNVAARLPHELVHRLDDALAMQQRAAVEQGINASLVAPSVEALVDGAA